jgi:putative membrane protein
MNIKLLAMTMAMGGALCASLGHAQTPDPSTGTGAGSTNPSAASSPQQRDSTHNSATESPATSGAEPTDASTPHQHEATKMSGQDKMAASKKGGIPPSAFVIKAGMDGMTEVEVGKIALEKSKSPGVRSFADQMVKDHSKANAELTSIAERKSYEVPKALDAKHQRMVDDLKSKSGAAFDTAYADHMSAAHADAVHLFTDASTSSDADIAAFAQKTLPTLKDHRKMADSLDSRLKTASAGTASKE